jgi:hypothetical protein
MIWIGRVGEMIIARGQGGGEEGGEGGPVIITEENCNIM